MDDKTFPYLEITTGDDYPGVFVTLKPRTKGSRLFGPFTGVRDLRATLVELQMIFKFRPVPSTFGQRSQGPFLSSLSAL